jgi:hypothetical protein
MLWDAFPDERTGLQFIRTIRFQSPGQVLKNSWSYLTVSFEFTGFSFCGLFLFAGLHWSYSTFILFTRHTSPEVEVNLQPTISRPVCLGVGLLSGAHDQIFFLSDNCRFLEVGRPLWWEDGPVIYSYNCFWALPEQSLWGPSPTELMTIFYFLIWDSPTLKGQVPVFISPRNRVAQLYPLGTGFPFCCLLQYAGLQRRYSEPTPHGLHLLFIRFPFITSTCWATMEVFWPASTRVTSPVPFITSSQNSISNKLLIYKTVLKPIWPYRIQLLGMASTSNI